MTIYCKIYETFHDQIPKDQDGRSYDKHHFLGTYINDKMLREGKHPSQQKKTCPKCNRTMSNANFRKWNHGENCLR